MKKNKRKKGTLSKAIKQHKYLYLLLFVPMVLFIFFKVGPILWTSIAFYDYSLFKGFAGSEWIGLENFKEFVTSKIFVRIVTNTLRINLLHILLGFPAPIILALMLNEISSIKFKRSIQTITYIPYFFSMIIVVSIVFLFLSINGPVNLIIKKFGYDPIMFMAKPKYFRIIYVMSINWQQTGWLAIIYLAAITSIDPQLYDAAKIDGAGRWRQITNITLPSISSTIITMFLLRLGDIMNVYFERIYLMSNPITLEVSEVISTFVYRRGILASDFSYATAAGIFNALIGLALVVFANSVSKKMLGHGLW